MPSAHENDIKKLTGSKEFTDEQILAANILAAVFPGMYASHGQLVRAENEAVDTAKRIIEIVKTKF